MISQCPAASIESTESASSKKAMFSMSACQDDDSRDSGIGLEVDDINEATTSNCSSQIRCLSRGMCELILEEESMDVEFENETNWGCTESKTVSFLNELGKTVVTKKTVAFADKTNQLVESPKGRPPYRKPFARVQSSFARKRTLNTELPVAKRVCQNDFASTSANSAIHRVQSSFVLERGTYSHVGDAQLPKLPEINYRLPTLEKHDSQAFRRITASTLSDLLRDSSFNDNFVLVDCRYPFEYNGGHIRHSINMFDPSKCEAMFYPSCEVARAQMQKRIPIFYCEYSQKRGPTMAQMLRTLDRQRNDYPKLDFEEVYVLDQGYRNFFATCSPTFDQQFCEPCSYVEMDDSRFTCQLRLYSFHKKSSIAATCARAAPAPRSRLLRRGLSEDSPLRGASRPLFSTPRQNSLSVLERLPQPKFS